MRTQEQKQYDENGKYIHKCMKQNCNREETEGEELTASGRGMVVSAEGKVALVAWGKSHRLSHRIPVWSLFICMVPACTNY